jgi:hypothetical protein
MQYCLKMLSSVILRRVALLRTTFNKERNPIIGMTGIGEEYLVFLRSVHRLLVTACVVLSLPILVTLMKEPLRSSDTSVLTRATRRNIPEDGILHSHCRGNLKSYIALIGWAL